MKVFILGFLILVSISGIGQITSGKVVFERRTNLLKKYTDDRMKAWLKDKKIKTDMFVMYFNDTMSVFKPQESDEADPLDWATTKNIVYQNLSQNKRVSILGTGGDKAYILDTLTARKWKMTTSKRKIAGYDCRRVIWEKNDSTRIHAWYSQELIPPIGPESFNGLPGTILGLATEDGGVVYFAKSVEVGVTDIASHVPEYPVKKAKTEAALKKELSEKFGDKPWSKMMLESLFAW